MRAFYRGWLIATVLLLGAGCGSSKKAGWLVGQWLLLDPDGKPGVCHEFKKEGLLVVIFAAPDAAAVDFVVDRLAHELGPRPERSPASSPAPPSRNNGSAAGTTGRQPLAASRPPAGTVQLRRPSEIGRWQITLGRARPGAGGVFASYEEALDARELAYRLRLDQPVVAAKDLLVYRLLLRDRAMIADLVTATLRPLTHARGGAEPLLETLAAYYDTGGNTTETARRLHLSVRAVTYRLERVTTLPGRDPTNPADRFTLNTAVLGAKLLDWPRHPIEARPRSPAARPTRPRRRDRWPAR